MFILGVLSLIQITLLPGLIALRLVRFKGSVWQSLLYIFALSLLINYCLVFILAATHLFSRSLILALFGIQVLWVAWLFKAEWQSSITDHLYNIWTKSIEAISQLVSLNTDEPAPTPKVAPFLFMLLTLVAFGLALHRIWWGFEVLYNNFGTVFDGWDALYSWNRWAGVWFTSQVPLDSRFYPQLIPANWSLPYAFLGDVSIQLFSKSIMPLFALGILIQLFDLGLTFKRLGYFAAVVFARALLVRFLDAGIYNGMVDIAVAFFALLPVYTLIKAEATTNETEQRKLWILGFFFAGAAALAKQAGVYIFLLYPFLVYQTLLRPKYGGRLNPSVWKDIMIWGSISALPVLIWYGFKLVLIFQGIDSSEVLTNAQYAAQAHGNTGLSSQILQALRELGAVILLYPLILIALPSLSALLRWLFALLLVPFPIIWAIMASYDTRNLAIFLPIFALVSGLAIEIILHGAIRLASRLRLEKLPLKIVPLALGLGVAIIAVVFFPDTQLRALDMEARQVVFSPNMNRELQRLLAENPNTRILTNYPVGYITGQESSQVTFWYGGVDVFERLLQDVTITHLLVPSVNVDPHITALINQWTDDGRLLFIMQDKGTTVIPYKLYAITRQP